MAYKTSVSDLTRIGVQSYTFRNFDLEQAIQKTRDCSIEIMEGSRVHVPLDTNAESLAGLRSQWESAGLKMPSYGVVKFEQDAAANRKRFEFAKSLGVELLTADPDPEAIPDLEILSEEFRIGLAIHNHGPGSRWDKIRHTMDAVSGRSSLLGACVDTGHALRTGQAPHEVIANFIGRVHVLHLKDWRGDSECAVGEGDMELDRVAEILDAVRFNGPVIFEYELEPDNPVPGLKRGIENWRQAAAQYVREEQEEK
jgi:sugar phosphate isomerase/epimerase